VSKQYNKETTMADRYRCPNTPCKCKVDREGAYCSEYCAQAVEQAIQRDYCQCEHPGCAGQAER
jgi:hypothetical protein